MGDPKSQRKRDTHEMRGGQRHSARGKDSDEGRSRDWEIQIWIETQRKGQTKEGRPIFGKIEIRRPKDEDRDGEMQKHGDDRDGETQSPRP